MYTRERSITPTNQRAAFGVARTGCAAAVTGALVLAGLVAAPTAFADTTANSLSDLTSAFSNATTSSSTVTLGSDLTSGGSTVETLADNGVLTLDLNGHALDLQQIVLGTAATLTITDSSTTGGTLTVDNHLDNSYHGAGIGVKTGTTLNITGTAHVNSTPDDDASAIGDGYYAGAGTINITGSSTVHALPSAGSGYGAGIGGDGSVVHIGGHATVVAGASDYGTGIGETYDDGSPSTITIDGDANVTATGGAGGYPGIGEAYTTGGTVSIGGNAVVSATGTGGGAGIGGTAGTWANGSLASVDITGTASVTATGSAGAAGIGGGLGDSSNPSGTGIGTNVTIGATASVIATGGSGASAIGAGEYGSDFGGLNNAGTLTIPSGADLQVLSGGTATNSGTIYNTGTISGSGTINNTGTIVNTGTVTATDVTGHNYSVAFDAGTGTVSGSSPVAVYANSFTDAQIPMPTATAAASTNGFTHWFTAASSGTTVSSSNSLSAAFGSSTGTPVTATLYARFAARPIASTAPLDAATVGTAYQASVAVSAGATPVTYALTSGSLPAGLTLNTSTGAITGTPTAAGTATFTIRASNDAGAATASYNITVAAATVTTTPSPSTGAGVAAPTFNAGPLGAATAGSSYSGTTAASGPGVSYAITAGTLPAGMELDPATGMIHGTAMTAGTYTFTITATNTAGSTTKTFVLTVKSAARTTTVKALTIATAHYRTGHVRYLAGSNVRVVIRHLVRGERYVITISGRKVATGTARTTTITRSITIPGVFGDALHHIAVTGALHQHVTGIRAWARTYVMTAKPGKHFRIITVPSTSAQAGTNLEVTITHLYPHEPVTVTYKGKQISATGALATSDGTYTVTVKTGWSWGTKAITVHGIATRTATKSIAITAHN